MEKFLPAKDSEQRDAEYGCCIRGKDNISRSRGENLREKNLKISKNSFVKNLEEFNYKNI